MDVKIKKLCENAVIPSYAKLGDAGMDLTATSMEMDNYGNVSYGTGLAIEIPEGYVGLLFPRSSICKKDITLTNCTGVIDSGYRGEIMLKFKPTNVFSNNPLEHLNCIGYVSNPGVYKVGERIGQIIIMPYPQINFIEVNELSDTERGEGGHGSTGV